VVSSRVSAAPPRRSGGQAGSRGITARRKRPQRCGTAADEEGSSRGARVAGKRRTGFGPACWNGGRAAAKRGEPWPVRVAIHPNLRCGGSRRSGGKPQGRNMRSGGSQTAEGTVLGLNREWTRCSHVGGGAKHTNPMRDELTKVGSPVRTALCRRSQVQEGASPIHCELDQDAAQQKDPEDHSVTTRSRGERQTTHRRYYCTVRHSLLWQASTRDTLTSRESTPRETEGNGRMVKL
jgi:hypothetical protein